MDQLKDFLRQCLKYRFWIAVGVSLLFPIIGFAVGIGAITEATTKREAEIKGAKGEIEKYTTPGIVNQQYQPIVASKKEELSRDVDATWRKLFALQEPLLKWPEAVEAKFRAWGRIYPKDVAPAQVQATITDYAIAYPDFISSIYKTFKPFDFETGNGIVVAPAKDVLLKPAPFSQDAPPELGKVWAEQERIWVFTALLDVIAKVNDSVGAKDWSGAIIKQINLIDVGSQADQDQKSLAKGDALVPSDVLLPDGVTAPVAAVPAGGMGGPMAGMGPMGAAPGGPGGKTEEVYYLKTEGQQYKILPIKMNVLVDQAKLPDFLVGLENSPMAIQVMEVEISKPLTPVTKPVFGERSTFSGGGGSDVGMGPGGGMMGRGMMGGGMMGGGMMGGRPPGGGDSLPGMGGMMGGRMGMGGPMGGPGAGTAKKGTDNRNAVKKDREKDTAKTKSEPKTKPDQYFNVIEVTVYGQARFYLAPPAPPAASPSTAPSNPAPDAPKDEPTEPEVSKPADPTPKKDEAIKKDEAPKKEEPPKKDEAPKKDEPAKPETPQPEVAAPKDGAPKPEPSPSKPDTAKADMPKNDVAPPK